MPNLIEVNRSGSVVWVVIDGHPLPVDWIESAYVDVDADRMPTVTLTLKASVIEVVNSVSVTRGIDNGEVDVEEAQEAAG